MGEHHAYPGGGILEMLSDLRVVAAVCGAASHEEEQGAVSDLVRGTSAGYLVCLLMAPVLSRVGASRKAEAVHCS
jgi:hypothetical protein